MGEERTSTYNKIVKKKFIFHKLRKFICVKLIQHIQENYNYILIKDFKFRV